MEDLYKKLDENAENLGESISDYQKDFIESLICIIMFMPDSIDLFTSLAVEVMRDYERSLP